MSATPTGASLPAGFEALLPWVPTWAMASEKDRYALRLATDLADLRVFYDAIQPQMERVMTYLAKFPADDTSALDVETRNLYRLALSYMEVSHPIELHWQRSDLDDAFPASRIVYQVPSSTGD